MKVFMLTQGEYSSYEVVALFTTQELAKEYALALATSEREKDLSRAREDLELYEREGSRWEDAEAQRREEQIEALRPVWSKLDPPEVVEAKVQEIRDQMTSMRKKRRDGYLQSIAEYEKTIDEKEIFDAYGGFRIEEQELYDMVPVVKDDD